MPNRASLVADDIRKTGHRIREDAKRLLARKIQRALVERNMIPAELARRAGLTRDNISTYMRAAALPSPDSLAKLARALDTTPDDLLPGRPDMTVSDPDQPVLEMTTDASGQTRLRIDRLVSLATAMKVIELLQADNDATSSDGKRGR